MRRGLSLGICMLAAQIAGGQTYQIILDGEDPVLSVESANWALDKTGTFNGNFKFSAPGPGDGSARAVWTIDGIPAGTFDVEFYVDDGDYAAGAHYIVESDSGIEDVVRSQQYVGSGWHELGTFDFFHQGRITQTDAWDGAGTKVIADAIRLTLHGTPEVPTVDVVPPEITLVIDDLGALNPNNSSTDTYNLFHNASPKIGYAVFPFVTYSASVLQAAQSLGIQTLLHQPMQYVGQQDTNPSDTTRLYIGMSDGEILSTLRNNLDSVAPYVVGINNHQGSRFSEYAPGLNVVMAELKARGDIFYDSRTISDSVAYDLAQQFGIPTVERDLFIDGNTVQETKDKILSLAMRAVYAPNYVHAGIGHQRVNTVPGIVQVGPELESMGVGYRQIMESCSIIIEPQYQPDGCALQIDGAWEATDDDMISQECRDDVALTLTGTTPGTATFTPNLPFDGYWRVFIGFTDGATNTTAANVTIQTAAGLRMRILDQSNDPNRWHYIGTMPFRAGTAGWVSLDNSLFSSAGETLKADCVKFQYDGALPESSDGWVVY